jgi:hypothetical protein
VERRILQVSAGISPAPAGAVRRTASEDGNPGHGFVLILVPRSLAGPHAVVVNWLFTDEGVGAVAGRPVRSWLRPGASLAG